MKDAHHFDKPEVIVASAPTKKEKKKKSPTRADPPAADVM